MWLGMALDVSAATFGCLLRNYQLATMAPMAIKDWKHKGLKKFFESGSTRGIQPAHTARIETRLDALASATCVDDMDLPGFRLHPYGGTRKGVWSVDVSGNWRITFEFKDGDAYVVNYEDPH